MTQLSEIVHSDPRFSAARLCSSARASLCNRCSTISKAASRSTSFSSSFPSVRRDQAVAALEIARAALLAGARSS